ncbi:restriction endonuclease subunit S [Methanobrevibacter sp.]|uniref:restriction endonuclease subunit S n=1 Tax=Methanobrevibacter sp. TaxID=66852 RepID=UPI00387009F9
MEWKSCKIGELGNIFSGGTPSTKVKEYWDGDLNWLSSGETRNTYIYTTEKFITNEGANNSSTKLANKGDIVIASAGQGFTRGQSSMVMIDTYVNQSVIVIHPNEKVNNFYLLYNLKFRYPELRQLSDHTSTRGSLTTKIIKDLDINLPNLIIQNKIANIIQYFDKKIETNKKINNHLDELCHLIFKYYFIDFMPFKSKGFIDSEIGEIPEGWKIITVGDILDCKLGGTPSRSNESYWGGDIAWINSGKVNEFRIIEPSEYITELGLKKSATKLLPAKTTVIAITGATLGQISLLEIDSCANQSVIGVIPNNKYPYEFVYPLISSILLDLLKHQTGGAQQHINKNNLESFNIVCPPADIISEYKNIVSSLYSQISANCFEIENLQKLRDTLLPKLMSGEIDVSKINYDLKRIIRKFILTLLNYLYENKNYFKNTKSNETLLKSRTIHKIDKYFTKFIRGYRYY